LGEEMTSPCPENNLVVGLVIDLRFFGSSFSQNEPINKGMNIKNFTGINAITTPAGQVSKTDRPIKSESSHEDRDANGQQLYDRKKKKEKMTDEQFQKAIDLLKEKKFIKEMNWIVMAAEENGVRYAWVKGQNDETIRKIIEYDMWELFDDPQPDSTKGQLLKKTA
jgi:hypothetical protein